MVLKVEQDGESTTQTPSGVCPLQNGHQNLTACKNNNDRKHIEDLVCEDFIISVDVLSTAVSVRDIALVKKCIDVINQQLNQDNVLFILNQTSKCEFSSPNNFEPSAPPLCGEEDHQQDCLENLVDNLRNNCLLEIDKFADFVLKHKDMLELEFRDILNITTRDTLQVTSESTVYSAVIRWGLEEGKRKGIASPVQNLKEILGELVYAPRYGLMTKSEFLCRKIDNGKCVDKGNVLTEDEMRHILDHIKRASKNQQGIDLPYKGSRPRSKGLGGPNLHSAVSNCSSTLSKSPCDKHIINFLTCWTAVFD